ncbi:putative lipase [Smittium mucronatum]|uniref:Putative lipase n=1 Tax=Smittium mucronatum TaxID=133383 RepID=A0A1R0GWF3_9FUNG|nr:putative lipase [Smittium mucronatum]
MSSLLVSTAQNLLNPDPEDVILDEVYGSLSIGDICRYRLSLTIDLPCEVIDGKTVFGSQDYILEKPRKFESTSNSFNPDLTNSEIPKLSSVSNSLENSFKGWNLGSVPRKIIITAINTSPIHKNLSLLKKEGPYSLSVLIKPDIDNKTPFKLPKTKKSSKFDKGSNKSNSVINSDSFISQKNHSKTPRLKEKPASCLAILCSGSWGTSVPLQELVKQEVEDWVSGKKDTRISVGEDGSLQLKFKYTISAISEVILPPAAVSFKINVKASRSNFQDISSTSAKLSLTDDTASLFQLPDPSIFKDESEPGIHLVVLSHGIHGSRLDLLYLHEQLLLKSNIKRKKLGANENRRVVLLTHDVNHGKTVDGIEAGGKRIANRIMELVFWFENEEWYKSRCNNELAPNHRISFIGHSLGGLYNVSSIEHLSIATSYRFFQIFKPINFISLASPWLGIFELGNVAQWACSWGILRQTGQDLLLGNMDRYEDEPLNSFECDPELHSGDSVHQSQNIKDQTCSKDFCLVHGNLDKNNLINSKYVDNAPDSFYDSKEYPNNSSTSVQYLDVRPGLFTETYIFKLSNPNSAAHKSLRLFKFHTAYANTKSDWEVGFLTSSILLDPKSIQEDLDFTQEDYQYNTDLLRNSDYEMSSNIFSERSLSQRKDGFSLDSEKNFNSSSDLEQKYNSPKSPLLADYSTVSSALSPWPVQVLINPLFSLFRNALSVLGLIDKERDHLVLRESGPSVPGVEHETNKKTTRPGNSFDPQYNLPFSGPKNNGSSSDSDQPRIFSASIDESVIKASFSGGNAGIENAISKKETDLYELSNYSLLTQKREYKLWALDYNSSKSTIVYDQEVPEADPLFNNFPCSDPLFTINKSNSLDSDHLSYSDLPGGYLSRSLDLRHSALSDFISTKSEIQLKDKSEIKSEIPTNIFEENNKKFIESHLSIGPLNNTVEKPTSINFPPSKSEIASDSPFHRSFSLVENHSKSNSKLPINHRNKSFPFVDSPEILNYPNRTRDDFASKDISYIAPFGIADSDNSRSAAWIQKMAQNWHTCICWRIVAVKFEYDAHHQIIVRREGSNNRGIPVIHHLLNNHDFD